MNNSKVKPVLSHTIICDDVRQEAGGKFSLMGLFEAIYTSAFPVMHPRFAIVNEWSGGRGEFVLKIRLLTPDRQHVLSESEAKMSLYSETQRHRDISLRFNTTFKSPGTYWLEMLLDNEQAGIVPLPVQLVSQEKVH